MLLTPAAAAAQVRPTSEVVASSCWHARVHARRFGSQVQQHMPSWALLSAVACCWHQDRHDACALTLLLLLAWPAGLLCWSGAALLCDMWQRVSLYASSSASSAQLQAQPTACQTPGSLLTMARKDVCQEVSGWQAADSGSVSLAMFLVWLYTARTKEQCSADRVTQGELGALDDCTATLFGTSCVWHTSGPDVRDESSLEALHCRLATAVFLLVQVFCHSVSTIMG